MKLAVDHRFYVVKNILLTVHRFDHSSGGMLTSMGTSSNLQELDPPVTVTIVISYGTY